MLKIFEVNFAGKLSDHINYFKLKSKELTWPKISKLHITLK